MNKLNWVYYRSYDIVINQYTLVFLICYLVNSIDIYRVKYVLSIVLLVLSLVLSYIQIPRYFHESFIPDDDYNYIFKIENSELEVIYNVRNMINDLNIENPRIITSTFFMPSFIEDSTYLFGKEKRYNHSLYTENSYELYLIFFPFDGIYDNFYPQGSVPQYDRTIELLDNCDYDILIVDNGNYYQDADGKYYPLTSLVEKDGKYQKTNYSTSRYAVYYLGE